MGKGAENRTTLKEEENKMKKLLHITMNNGDIFEIRVTDNWLNEFASYEYLRVTKSDGKTALLRANNISSVEEA